MKKEKDNSLMQKFNILQEKILVKLHKNMTNLKLKRLKFKINKAAIILQEKQNTQLKVLKKRPKALLKVFHDHVIKDCLVIQLKY